MMANDEHIVTTGTENQIKGAAYERQIVNLIRQSRPAYLWKYTPEGILIQNGMISSHNANRLNRKNNKNDSENPLMDTGIDIIVMENETECGLVQCKNGYKNGIRIEDLAGFWSWAAVLSNKKAYVYYTSKLTRRIQSLPTQDRIHFIRVPFDTSYMPTPDQISSSQSLSRQKQIFIPDSKKLEYQIKARDLAIEYYRTRDSGILSMPCGTGKTYTAFLIAQNFKQIVILSPLKQFAKQNLDRFIEYGYPPENILLVDSDGCRDKDMLLDFIKHHKSTGWLISATYDSTDVLSEIIPSIENPTQTLFICDEFHNLSARNIYDETDPMNKIITADGYKKIYMSATPRIYELEDDGETGDYLLGKIIYNMSFKYAIEQGFITDYRIWIPSIHEDLTDLRKDISKELNIKDVLGSENIICNKAIYLFSCLVNTGAHKCIIYCQDIDEITQLMKTIEQLNLYYCLDLHMDRITGELSASSRTQILTEFADSDKLALLFSVRILDECIDIPSCDSIYITYPTKSKVRTIQRLMRCTRTVPNNRYKIGNVFIWCAEYESILETLGGIKEIDEAFADKVIINEVGHFNTSTKTTISKPIEEDNKLIKKLVIGIKEFRFQSWLEKLEQVKNYMNENLEAPSKHNKEHKIQVLGRWLLTQKKNYKDKKDNMLNKSISDTWCEFINNDIYKQYFLTNTESWMATFEKLKNYISINSRLPSKHDTNTNISSLASWCSTQNSNYKEKTNIMKKETIYSEWHNFINHQDYKDYFISNDDVWKTNFNKLKEYIAVNNRLPSKKDTNNDIKSLGSWVSGQNMKYKNNKFSSQDIYDAWEGFINHPDYKIYFISNDEIWEDNFKKLKEYIDANNRLPSKRDSISDIKSLGAWVVTQNCNYSNDLATKGIDGVNPVWHGFINHPDYKEYFLSNDEIWFNNFSKLKEYITTNHKLPSKRDTTDEIARLGKWVCVQNGNYKDKTNIMKNVTIYIEWHNFINHPDNKDYFQSNDEIWMNNFSKLKQYIAANNRLPSKRDSNQDIKSLGAWVCVQNGNFKEKKNIMKDELIYTEWHNFINHPDYKKYFLNNTELWHNMLDKLTRFISENNKLPSKHSQDSDIKTLGNWLGTTKAQYKTRDGIMGNSEIFMEWANYIRLPEHKKYFFKDSY